MGVTSGTLLGGNAFSCQYGSVRGGHAGSVCCKSFLERYHVTNFFYEVTAIHYFQRAFYIERAMIAMPLFFLDMCLEVNRAFWLLYNMAQSSVLGSWSSFYPLLVRRSRASYLLHSLTTYYFFFSIHLTSTYSITFSFMFAFLYSTIKLDCHSHLKILLYAVLFYILISVFWWSFGDRHRAGRPVTAAVLLVKTKGHFCYTESFKRYHFGWS